jgi:DNA polymerase III epsilon subunit-like protein
MKILFLDVETNGVKPTQDQVIEIGGVIIDLDPSGLEYKEISSFEQVILPRQEVSDKILRLTGITREELSFGESLSIVQEKWLEWLEPEADEILAIAGHSVDFDLGFLQSEGWFLPKAQIIDTLNLARVLLPHKRAVNLEYLLESFKLTDESGHHRSLFDSRGSAKLFIHLLKQLQIYPLPDVFSNKFQDLILPDGLEIYTTPWSNSTGYTKSRKTKFDQRNQPQKPTPKDTRSILETNPDIQIINYLAEPIYYNFNSRLDEVFSLPGLQKLLQELQEPSLPKKIQILLLQLVYTFIIHLQEPKWKLKIHVRNPQVDYQILAGIYKLLNDQKESKPTKDYLLPRAESILWEIRDLAELSLPIRQIQEFLELMCEFDLPEQIEGEIKTFLTDLDFLVMQVQSQMKNNLLEMSLDTPLVREERVIQKWQHVLGRAAEIKVALQELSQSEATSEVLKYFIQHIFESWKFADFESSRQLKFYYAFGWLVASKEQEVNLGQVVNELSTKFEPLTIETMIDAENIEVFGKITGINTAQFKPLLAEGLMIEKRQEAKVSDLIFESLERLKDKPILFLSSINSTMEAIKDVAIKEFAGSPLLIMGDTGSLTKIASKLTRNPKSVVFIKVSQFDKFLSLLGNSSYQNYFGEIWFLKRPFLYLHQYWLSKSHRTSDHKEYLQKLRNLHTIGQINNIFYKTGVTPGLVEEVR